MALRAISSGVRAGVALMWLLASLIAVMNDALSPLLLAYSTKRFSFSGGETTLKPRVKSVLDAKNLRTVTAQLARSPFQMRGFPASLKFVRYTQQLESRSTVFPGDLRLFFTVFHPFCPFSKVVA